MWYRWSLRAKIVGLTVGVVLPIMAGTTALAVRLYRSTLEDDIRNSGLALARELAASAASRTGTSGEAALQRELGSVLGRGSLVRDAAVYAVGRQGLTVRVAGGQFHSPGPDDEVAAREGQEVVALRREGPERMWRIAVPVWMEGRSVGAVSLDLPLGRVDALAKRVEHQAIFVGAATVVLLVGTLALFMNRAIATPLGRILQVMGWAEAGDLDVRVPEDRHDEVGQVARGLNRMLGRVGSFQAELSRRVEEATAELRATNQRLFAAQQQVARNERLAAAGELAAAMAHDVGTPLTGVSGHLQLLGEEVSDPAIQERLQRIQKQVDRAVVAARRFLDVARPAPSREPVDVKALLLDLLVLTSPEAQRKAIAVEPAFAEGIPVITADPNQLQELFLNLIANALEAMGSGGTLQLSAEPALVEGGGAGVRVTVSDTGPGIPTEILSRAFEPFFTTRASVGGTGLGLAIVRRVARDHGGSVRLESEPGKGTRAIVEL
ncbi:MAG TPA: HAMP domain-containing sensor histidine kinase, partial [archaeon]|nr:HAMP domain-containing sensor histidine kinase [archaeon]